MCPVAGNTQGEISGDIIMTALYRENLSGPKEQAMIALLQRIDTERNRKLEEKQKEEEAERKRQEELKQAELKREFDRIQGEMAEKKAEEEKVSNKCI